MSQMFRYPCLLVLLLSIFPPVGAMERKYLAPMEDSFWKMTVATPLHCEMEHEIPRFGKAVFYQSAGRRLQLKLVTHQYFKSGIEVNFLSESPHWKPVSTEFKLASLSTRESNVLLDVGSRTAKHAYLELQDGFRPGFYFAPNADLVDPTVVMMSTVRFRSVGPEFEQCIGNLYHENFDDIRLSRVHFDHDDEFPIPSDEEAVMGRLLDYLEIDKSITEVVVSGHADETGAICYNDTLSEKRALYVYDLLVSEGVDPRIIAMDFFGESRPLVKGKTRQELGPNRRVTIELRR